MQIGTLKPEHVKKICVIEKATFPEPWSEDSFFKEVSNPLAHYSVITENDDVVAYGGFWKIVDEGHITNIAVNPAFRGQGYGNAVMQAMLDCAKKNGVHSLTLEVRASNTVAQNLYKKFKFTSAGLRPKYYSDGEDAMIMWLEDL